MDFLEFYEKWIPEHWESPYAVHLYINSSTNKLEDLVWIDSIRNSKNKREVIHDKVWAPLPETVFHVKPITDRKPYVILHYEPLARD